MRLEVGDLVEIVASLDNIEGTDVRPGMRGYVVGYSKRSQSNPLSWIVDFHGRKALCYPKSIRLVLPDPGHAIYNWKDCIWKPAALKLK